jgi:hypothetical protein
MYMIPAAQDKEEEYSVSLNGTCTMHGSQKKFEV